MTKTSTAQTKFPHLPVIGADTDTSKWTAADFTAHAFVLIAANKAHPAGVHEAIAWARAAHADAVAGR